MKKGLFVAKSRVEERLLLPWLFFFFFFFNDVLSSRLAADTTVSTVSDWTKSSLANTTDGMLLTSTSVYSRQRSTGSCCAIGSQLQRDKRLLADVVYISAVLFHLCRFFLFFFFFYFFILKFSRALFQCLSHQ